MGIIKRGVLGGFSGKVANVVGSSWKGIAVMKSLPLSVANPRTVGQVSQRTKFSAVVDLGSKILTTIVKPFWDRFAVQKSGYNDFVSNNIDAFSSTGLLTPTLLIASKGSLQDVSFASISPIDAGNNVQVALNPNIGVGNALTTDMISFLFIGETSGTVFAIFDADFRNNLVRNYNIGPGFVSPEVVYIYVCVRRVDGSMVSNSVFAAANKL